MGNACPPISTSIGTFPVEERTLLIRGILADVRELIRVNDARAAANQAARAAYLLCELDSLEMSEDVLNAIKESIRLSAHKEE